MRMLVTQLQNIVPTSSATGCFVPAKRYRCFAPVSGSPFRASCDSADGCSRYKGCRCRRSRSGRNSPTNTTRRAPVDVSVTLAYPDQLTAAHGRGYYAIPSLASYAGDGPIVFAHACRLGAEGIVSKKVDGTYRSGPCGVWIKVRNPASITVRERSENWNR
jgi:hypothetical protein